MSALPGEHLCIKHQGNHSHYDEKNCRVCTLERELAELSEQRRVLNKHGLLANGLKHWQIDRAIAALKGRAEKAEAELAAIKSAEMPEEPEIIGVIRKAFSDGLVPPANIALLHHIDAIHTFALRMKAEAEALRVAGRSVIATFTTDEKWTAEHADAVDMLRREIERIEDAAIDKERGK